MFCRDEFLDEIDDEFYQTLEQNNDKSCTAKFLELFNFQDNYNEIYNDFIKVVTQSDNNINITNLHDVDKIILNSNENKLSRFIVDHFNNLNLNLEGLSLFIQSYSDSDDKDFVNNFNNIRRLKNLKIFQMSNIDNWCNLQYLFSIPSFIFELINLNILDLRSNKISEVPKEINKLVNLTKLLLGYNQVESLPETIGNLINLEVLDLQVNKLRSLPENIGNLVNLEVLNLENNELTSLPESLNRINKLKQLYLLSNKISFDQIANHWIEYLTISVDRIDQSIKNFVNLTKLYIFLDTNNEKIKVPSVVSDLKNLTILIFSSGDDNDNCLSLPNSLTQLENLKNIYFVDLTYDDKSEKILESLVNVEVETIVW